MQLQTTFCANGIFNVPPLRFPEFSGGWEKCKLGEIATFFSGGTPSSSQKSFYVGNIPFIRSGEIHSDTTELFLSEEGLKRSSARIIDKGDLLIALYGATSGDIAISKITGAINQAILCVRTIHNKTFLKGMWERHIDYVLRTYLQGGQGNLSADIVKNLCFYIPALEEQDKISRFLQLIDKRIELQNVAIEDLKRLRRAIRKRLLTDKSLLEQTRFVSSVGRLKNGYAFQSSTYIENGEYSIITISNVTGDRYINTEICNTISDKPNDLQLHQELKPNDILISLTGNVGRVSLCKEGKYLLNQRVGLLSLFDNDNYEYIYQVLSDISFEKSMIATGQGAAQMNISKNDIENYMIPYSTNGKTIERIAKILELYDKLIINTQMILSLYNKQKKYLLQQMFI